MIFLDFSSRFFILMRSSTHFLRSSLAFLYLASSFFYLVLTPLAGLGSSDLAEVVDGVLTFSALWCLVLPGVN